MDGSEGQETWRKNGEWDGRGKRGGIEGDSRDERGVMMRKTDYLGNTLEGK